MTTRSAVILTVVAVCFGSLALAQPADPPLVNWTAPAYWTPPSAGEPRRGVASEEILNSHGVSTQSLPSSPLPFVAVTPCRLYDNRASDPPFTGDSTFNTDGQTELIDFYATTTTPYAANGNPNGCTLPTAGTVGAWSLKFTYRTSSATQGYLTAYPGSLTTRPGIGTILGVSTQQTSGAAIVPAGTDTDNTINVYAQYAANTVVIDYNGYFAPTNLTTTPNPMQIAMLQWYTAANIPAHFTAGGDINGPAGLAFDGAHIWVANISGNSVTELNASDGSKVSTFTAGGDINAPEGLAFDGAHIWVSNWGAGTGLTVTELNASDGSKVGTFTAGGDINGPARVLFDGAHIWVANYTGNSVTELNASNGSKVGTFTAGGDIKAPNGLAFDGAHIWVANSGNNSVTELNASDGGKVGTFSAGGDISQPEAVAFDGAHIWVGSGGGGVTELNASDGSKVGTFNAGGDISGPFALVFDGAHIWVANYNGNSVTELNASDGSKVGTFTAGGDMNHPYALAFDGAHIWVANSGGTSVDKL